MARGLSARERRFLLAGAAALLLFLAGREGMRRGVSLGGRSRALLAEKLTVLGAYREAVGREEGLRAEAERLDREIAAREEGFLPGETPALAAADLQTRLKALADRAGLKIQSEKIMPSVKREAFLEVPVQIVATGDVKGLRDFVVAVEASPVFMAVREASLRTVKRRQFVPETRTYVEISDLQASMTLFGLVRE